MSWCVCANVVWWCADADLWRFVVDWMYSSPECQKLHWDAGHRQECRQATKKAEKKAKKKAAKKEKEKMAKGAVEEVD